MNYQLEKIFDPIFKKKISDHLKYSDYTGEVKKDWNELKVIIYFEKKDSIKTIKLLLAGSRPLKNSCNLICDLGIGFFDWVIKNDENNFLATYDFDFFELVVNNLIFTATSEGKISIITPLKKYFDFDVKISISDCYFNKINISGILDMIELKNVINVSNISLDRIISKNIYLEKLNPKATNPIGNISLSEVSSQTFKINNSNIGTITHNGDNINKIEVNSYIKNNIKSISFKNINLNHLGIIYNKISFLKIDNIETGHILFQENTIEKLFLMNLDFVECFSDNQNKYNKLRFFGIANEFNFFNSTNVKWSYGAFVVDDLLIEETDFLKDKTDVILRLLLQMKHLYSIRKDVYNERTFEAFEKRWYYENNDNFEFSLWASWNSNSFGLSILKPFILFCILFFIQVVLFLLLTYNEKNILLKNWGVFLNILNPTHRTDTFIQLLNDNNLQLTGVISNLLFLIDNIFRIILGFLIFQIISAFRYKYNLR